MIDVQQNGSEPLSSIRRQLEHWERRRQLFLDDPTTPDEIAIILRNTAHLFVYLDGNRNHIDCTRFKPYLDALYSDIGALCNVLPEPLSTVLHADLVAAAGQRDEEVLLGAVEAVRDRLTADRLTLLSRLGVRTAGGPEAAFARLLGGLGSAASRAKLAMAWNRLSEKHAADLIAAIEQVLDARWSRFHDLGHASPLEATLQRSSLTEAAAEQFLIDYLSHSIHGYREMENIVGEATGCTDGPMNHFAAYLAVLASGHRMPLIPLLTCVDTAIELIETMFDGRVVRKSGADAVVLYLRAANGLSGLIQIDCLPGTGAHVPDLPVDGPIGRALARCRNTDQERTLTFEAAWSLMHEIGHAVGHVLLAPRWPGLTGLEYMPVERLENLSAWFEKWVFHPRFSARVPEPERSRLPIAAQIKHAEFRATQLQRAIVALVDFRLHRTRVGVQEAFQQISEEFGIEGCYHIVDLLPHLGAPVFRVHPGLAGLCYLWSYAYGTEVFEMTEPRQALRPCLDPSLPSVTPGNATMPTGLHQICQSWAKH